MAKKEYKVICISVFSEDLVEMDRLSKELTQRFGQRISRSELIRLAIDQFDIESVTRRTHESHRYEK